MKENLNVEQSYQTLIVIWFALIVSQAIFFVLIYFAKPEVMRFDFSKPLLGDNAPVILVFALLAFVNLALSFVLERKNISQAIAEQKIEFVQTGLIIGCALCEGISLFGVVLAFAFSYSYFFLWIALGILGTILHFPKRDNLIAASYKR